MNNSHLLLTRVPLEYCRFRSEYFFFRFDSRLKREAYNLVMVSKMYLKITELHYQNINKNMLSVYLFSIIAKYQNKGTLHNKRLFRKLSHTFQPKRRHFQGNKQWKMMPFREWHRHTQEKRTRSATIRSRTATVRLILQMLFHWIVRDSWQVV